MAKTKRKNPQDLNLKNLHAMKKRIGALETAMKQIKKALPALFR